MRTPITLKIKFKSSNLDQFIERYSVDVSRGGIFIRTKEPLPVGTQLRFEFQLQDASALIAGEGTVVWIREHDPARQGVAPGMGVRFDKLAAESQKVLDRILAEKQKRGDAQLESRFDAGVRASASASGTLSSNKGHNDFSGGDSKSFTPLPGAVPGLETPGDEFGSESTRVMQNELVQSLTAKTRDHEDLASAFAEPELTRKASVEELKLAVQGSAVEKAPETSAKVEVAKVEIAADVVKVEPAPAAEAKPEAKKDEPTLAAEAKPEAKKDEPTLAAATEAKTERKKSDAKVDEPKLEAKKDDRKAEPKKDGKKPDGKADGKKDEKRADASKDDERAEGKGGGKKDVKQERPAAAYPQAAEAAPRKRSNMPLFGALALVCAVGGYTVIRNKADDEQKQPPPSQPAPTQVAQNDSPKPTESAAAATATGDKPPAAPTPAEAPNPNQPAKEPTAALDKPPGLSVTVMSDPAGATVTVDGKPLPDPTPTTLANLDGKKIYDVRLAMKGFHDWKVKLKPKAGDKLDAALVPNEKVVEVATTPAGADVVLDGKRVGKTPYTIHKLDLSKAHALEVKRAGFVAQTRSISASDTFESKGDKDVLAVAMTLAAAEKPAAADKPAAEKPAAADKPAVATAPRPRPARKPAVKKPAEAAPVADKPAEAASSVDKPAEAAPSADKPAMDKPTAAEKPAATEKPAADKPAATEKPAADKPAGDKAGIKVPSWMKQKPAEGAPTTPPASEPAP